MRFLKSILFSLLMCFTAATVSAETYNVYTGTRCESCDFQRFSLNFEADGSDAGGYTLKTQVLSMFFNEKTGKWEGRGLAELREGATRLISDPMAEYEVVFVPSGGASGCPGTQIESIVIRGRGANPGEHFIVNATMYHQDEQMGCPHRWLRGTVVLERGLGTVKRIIGR